MATLRGEVVMRSPRRVALGWAFVERPTNLWKRYWGWELAWLLYGVVNTLSITFIAKEAGKSRIAALAQVPKLMLFLLIGTLVWAYLVIMWER